MGAAFSICGESSTHEELILYENIKLDDKLYCKEVADLFEHRVTDVTEEMCINAIKAAINIINDTKNNSINCGDGG